MVFTSADISCVCGNQESFGRIMGRQSGAASTVEPVAAIENLNTALPTLGSAPGLSV